MPVHKLHKLDSCMFLILDEFYRIALEKMYVVTVFCKDGRVVVPPLGVEQDFANAWRIVEEDRSELLQKNIGPNQLGFFLLVSRKGRRWCVISCVGIEFHEQASLAQLPVG